MPPAASAARAQDRIPMVVPVRSNRGNVTIPLADESFKVLGDLLLFAGPNLVPAEKWEQAKRQPGTQVLLREKIKAMRAEEFTKGMSHTVGRTILEEGEPVPADAPLSAMSETAAIELVKDVSDQTMLARLKSSESRAPVRRAIDARIEEIKDPAKAATAAEAAAGMGRATIAQE